MVPCHRFSSQEPAKVEAWYRIKTGHSGLGTNQEQQLCEFPDFVWYFPSLPSTSTILILCSFFNTSCPSSSYLSPSWMPFLLCPSFLILPVFSLYQFLFSTQTSEWWVINCNCLLMDCCVCPLDCKLSKGKSVFSCWLWIHFRTLSHPELQPPVGWRNV